jgi:Domain of unknown function (DUF4276)
MKVGMIFECGQNGADGKVYPYLAKQIRPDIDISPFFLDSKPKLIERCGDAAKSLLEIDGCEQIIIIWDLQPPWQTKKEDFCPIADCVRIRNSFQNAQLTSVQLQKLHLICIVQELETLLLFDVQAISEYLKGFTNRPCKVRHIPHPENHKDPKDVLYRIFQSHRCRKYEDRRDAEKMIKLVNINKLRNCLAFQRFEKTFTSL